MGAIGGVWSQAATSVLCPAVLSVDTRPSEGTGVTCAFTDTHLTFLRSYLVCAEAVQTVNG